MEFLSHLSVMDVFVVAMLTAGVFLGFTQGLVRYALNALLVLVAFVIAAQLEGPLFDLLGFWTAFTPALREEIIFLFLYLALVVAGWFVARAIGRGTEIGLPRQLDELGGAILGLLWVVLFITFLMVVMDTFFLAASDNDIAAAGILKGFYEAMDSSALVELFRNTIIPTFGYLVRFVVPSDTADFLEPS